MKIKPKKITNVQTKILETLAENFNKSQLQKLFFDSGVRHTSIYNLSFSDARKLIDSLTNSL